MSAQILIAEDEVGIRTALTTLLEYEGHQVKTVQDGIQALDIVRGGGYDLVITDIRMPGINGLKLLDEITQLPGAPEVIVMTAYGTIETAIQALKNGARDFLLKPFSNELLRVTVDRALEIRELSVENKKLHELERMKKEFITMIAHELRTPLTAVKGYLKLVLSGMVGELNESQKEYLGVVHQNSENLHEITNRMIDMGNLEMSDFNLDTTSASTLGVIWEAIEEVQESYEKKHLNLEINLATSLRPIMVDSYRMKQIITFLLDNAIAFSRPNRRIWLSVDSWKGVERMKMEDVPMSYVELSDLEPIDYIEISIRDEGPGIPKDKLSQIFEKFYQIEDLYIRQVGGMGIGLSLCKKLVGLMGGKIWVESRLGQGCKFTFVLPWHQPEEQLQAAEEDQTAYAMVSQTQVA
ncbi:response regulator [bacterium]|nr:response regulator [bacterium]